MLASVGRTALRVPTKRRLCSNVAAANKPWWDTSDFDGEIDAHNRKWRLVGGTVIERIPVCEAKPAKWEVDFREMQKQHRFDTDLHIPKELLREKEKTMWDDFEPAPHITEDDIFNNQKSLNRALDQFLYLVVKRKDSGEWMFPQGKYKKGRSMREFVERDFQKRVGRRVVSYFISNMPSAHLEHIHPNAEGGYYGTKAFFYRAQYLRGNLELASVYSDYKWLTKGEVKEHIDPDVYSYMKGMLLAIPQEGVLPPE